MYILTSYCCSKTHTISTLKHTYTLSQQVVAARHIHIYPFTYTYSHHVAAATLTHSKTRILFTAYILTHISTHITNSHADSPNHIIHTLRHTHTLITSLHQDTHIYTPSHTYTYSNRAAAVRHTNTLSHTHKHTLSHTHPLTSRYCSKTHT